MLQIIPSFTALKKRKLIIAIEWKLRTKKPKMGFMVNIASKNDYN